MNAENDKSQSVQELLRLKREPVRMPDLTQAIKEGLRNPPPPVRLPWWRQIPVSVQESRTVQVSLLGGVVGSLLVAGLAYSNSIEKKGESGAFQDASSLVAAHASNAAAPKLLPSAAAPSAPVPASTDPLLGTNTSLFRFNTLGTRAQPVSFGLDKN